MLAQKIDRQSVLSRNNPKVTSVDSLSSLSVGNGRFVTTVDVTGLQSYPLEYQNGVPLCSMSDWGWHSFPNVGDLKVEESQKTMNLGHGREEIYAVEYKTQGRNQQATEYYRVNPHRLNLGNIALVIRENGKQIPLSQIKDINQELDLYNGVINSSYKALGEKVNVTTACVWYEGGLLSKVDSKLLSKGKAIICISFPYPTGRHSDSASDFYSDSKHVSEIVESGSQYAVIKHNLDDTSYWTTITWEGKAKIEKQSAHSYCLKPKGKSLAFHVRYTSDDNVYTDELNFSEVLDDVKQRWNDRWDNGPIVDFSSCTDSRAKELERRTVLSQYLTYINCANGMPPQETGLTYNSWYGRPHLEMTWWHAVDFSLWGNPEYLMEILDWYNETAYPVAKKIAERQGFKGVRWMKMTDPKAGEAPSNVGSFLTWQQPHYIYMAEELYRRASDATTHFAEYRSQKQILDTYGKNVDETAEFLADFAKSCQQKDGKIYLYGQTAMQESMSKDFSYGHPFEHAYFVYGLTTAQKWRERTGLSRNAEWDEIISNMASFPEYGDIYTAGIPTQPFNYGGESGKKQLTADDFYLKCRSDHPAILGACGLIPDYGLYDKAKMKNTLSWVMSNWNWATTWGWDFGMTAMCAARLGDGETAIRALLLDEQKNRYLISGHNYQEPKRLRIYLPGNGALLDAIAMMCAGWDGCENIKNPGFPQNGKWNVHWEGLNKMQ